ncbi:MAG: hypothetical protein KKI08_13885, partial [Armatimonadetes bacterium]|nr:hypothetical protein [Armatimonadota bacterium]
IIFGGYSISTGCGHGDINDSVCRVQTFDASLRRLWKSEQLGAHFVGANVCALPQGRGRRPGVHAFTAIAGGMRTELGSVHGLDPRDGHTLFTYRANSSLRSSLAAALTPGRETNVVALPLDGALQLLDPEGRSVHPVIQLGGPFAQVHFAADLDGDGSPELVSGDQQGRLFVTDLSGFESCRVSRLRYEPGPDDKLWAVCAPWDVDGDGRCEVVVAPHTESGALGLDLYKVAPASPIEARLGNAPGGVPGELTAFEWAPHGESLLVQDNAGAVTLRRWRRGSGETVATLRDVRGAAFSADGRQLAAVVEGVPVVRPIAARLVVAPTHPSHGQANAMAVRLPPQAAPMGALPHLARGGRLVVIDTSTGRARDLATGDFDARVAWTRAGQVVASRVAGPSMDLFTYDPAGGAGRPLPGASRPDVDEAAPLVSGADGFVAFTRWDAVRLPFRPDYLAAKLWSVPADGGETRALNTDAALYRGLRAIRAGLDQDFLRRLDQPEAHYLFSTCVQAAGSPQLPLVASRLTVLGGHTHEQTTDFYLTPTDIWVTNAATGEMQAVTCDDERLESDPTLSPDGRWISFVTHPAAEGPETRDHVVVSGVTGEARLDVGEGACPQWSPTNPAELWFLRNGELRSATLSNQPPPRQPLSRGQLVLLGVLVGMVLTGSSLALRVPGRLAVLTRASLLALQMARQSGQSLLLVRIIRRLADLHAAIHALKNTVMVMPAYGERGEEDAAATLAYVVDPENVAAVMQGSQRVLRLVGEFAAHAREDRTVLRQLPPESAAQITDTVALLIASQELIERYIASFERDSGEFTAAGERGEAPTKALCERTLSDLTAFYELLTDERERTGLMDRLRDSLRHVQLLGVLQEARAATASQAAALGCTVTVAPSVSPMVYTPGDPTPLRQVLIDTIGNALEAVQRQQGAGAAAAEWNVEIAASEEGPAVVVSVRDNGCGLEAELVARLNSGATVSTKGQSRGGGFAAACRAMAAYPHGGISIASDGPGAGATVALTFEKA